MNDSQKSIFLLKLALDYLYLPKGLYDFFLDNNYEQ